MSNPDFLAMRASLVARGLLSEDGRLTERGNAHVDATLDRFRKQTKHLPEAAQ